MVLGAVAVLGGAALAAVVGPDDTVALGPHRLTSTGQALATAPRVIGYSGPTLQLAVTATSPGSRLFVGIGPDVDVRNYLTGTAYTRIDDVSLPWRVTQTAIPGQPRRLPDPRQLDWWLTTGVGDGSASADLPLPDEPIDIVVMDLTATDGFSVDVRAGIHQPGAFLGGLAAVVGGIGLLVVGWLIARGRVSGPGSAAQAPSPPRSAPRIPAPRRPAPRSRAAHRGGT